MKSAFTPRHKAHLDTITEEVQKRIHNKYYKGAVEHGGHLSEMPLKELLENILDESIDKVVYVIAALQALEIEEAGVSRKGLPRHNSDAGSSRAVQG